MKEFPKGIKFCFPWRSYQSAVLKDLESHLDDNHLNIVAAPGSGKTILGLEVMLRINKPTLILAPSIAIRNQWIMRFKENFLQTENIPNWISDNIKEPKFLTVSTYQGLHAALNDIEEIGENGYEKELTEVQGEISLKTDNKVLKRLKRIGIQTIIIDEAHHLRNVWWESLIFLNNNIVRAHVVALTATPPYDVSPQEWRNYQNLCGPIDAEISVPELVQEKNLCPHQDYIYLNSLSKEEKEEVNIFRKNVKIFMRDLQDNKDFIKFLASHAYLEKHNDYIEQILKNPEYFSSMLIFLNEVGIVVSPKLLQILGVSKKRIPNFSLEWAEILLHNFIYHDTYAAENYKEIVDDLKVKLKKIGAIEKRNVFLQNNSQIKKLLKESLNKLNSILDIVKIESDNLGDSLRMVILTDYIRKEISPKKGDNNIIINKIGVVPIFEKIRVELPEIKKIGILTGSLVVVPCNAKPILINIAQSIGIAKSHLKITQLDHDDNFLKIAIKGESNQKIVHLITEVFNAGEIEILVGTKSLLGEGWDAPTINTLILATFVGSFMLSNQMRGRAIRIDKNKPDKISNIWHLASVEKNNAYPGHDFDTLKRRFNAFVGLSFQDKSIENGFERMGIGKPPFSEKNIIDTNINTIKCAKDRVQVKEKWESVLHSGDIKKIIPEIKTDKAYLPREFILYNTIFALFWRSLLGGVYFFLQSLQGLGEVKINNIKSLLGIIILITLVISLPGMIKSLWLFLRNGPIGSNIKQVGNVVLKTLCNANIIKTDVNQLRIISEVSKMGVAYCGLDGGTSYEKSLFLDCLEEIFNPIENPRYILTRKSKLNFWLREDYHTVPKIIGTHKKNAQFFSLMWSKYIGVNNLVYTRSIKGRKLLLKARKKSMSTSFQKRSERRNTWK